MLCPDPHFTAHFTLGRFFALPFRLPYFSLKSLPPLPLRILDLSSFQFGLSNVPFRSPLHPRRGPEIGHDLLHLCFLFPPLRHYSFFCIYWSLSSMPYPEPFYSGASPPQQWSAVAFPFSPVAGYDGFPNIGTLVLPLGLQVKNNFPCLRRPSAP